MARSAKQAAASRANLVKARAARGHGSAKALASIKIRHGSAQAGQARVIAEFGPKAQTVSESFEAYENKRIAQSSRRKYIKFLKSSPLGGAIRKGAGRRG